MELFTKQLQWFPGHMAKGLRQLKEYLPIIDLALVVLDSRVPLSSFPSNVETMFKSEKVLLVFNKTDLTDLNKLIKFENFYKDQGFKTIRTNLKNQADIKNLFSFVNDYFVKNGILTKRIAVIGIPNVGKSTLINIFNKKNSLKVENRPGVTKSVQWIKTAEGIHLLDTPGILLPKYDTRQSAVNLTLCNALKSSVVPIEEVIQIGLDFLIKHYPKQLFARYKIEINEETRAVPLINAIALKRGWLLKGGEKDFDKAYAILFKEISDGIVARAVFDAIDQKTN